MTSQPEVRRSKNGTFATQAEVCSSTDTKPCQACHECMWWERLWAPLPPGYEHVRSDFRDRWRGA